MPPGFALGSCAYLTRQRDQFDWMLDWVGRILADADAMIAAETANPTPGLLTLTARERYYRVNVAGGWMVVAEPDTLVGHPRPASDPTLTQYYDAASGLWVYSRLALLNVGRYGWAGLQAIWTAQRAAAVAAMTAAGCP
jgi:hypothetical protein